MVLELMADALAILFEKVKLLLYEKELSTIKKENLLCKTHNFLCDVVEKRKKQRCKVVPSEVFYIQYDGAALQFPESERCRAKTVVPVK